MVKSCYVLLLTNLLFCFLLEANKPTYGIETVAGVMACDQDSDFNYACGEGPNGCNVIIDQHMVDIPRDGSGFPQSPFTYNIPGTPTTGQFRVEVRYRTRDDAEASSVTYEDNNGNIVNGTSIDVSYGSDANYAASYEGVFTNGTVSSITVTNTTASPIQPDDLPGLEVLVFRCDNGSGGAIAGAYPNEFVWTSAPDVGTNPYCVTRTICLPDEACATDRQLTLTSGIFNIHQDNATCDRQLLVSYTTDDGGTNESFVETPPENNSLVEHTFMVAAAATEITIELCTCNNPNGTACNGLGFNCSGVSFGWSSTLVSDGCTCTPPVVCSTPTATAEALVGSCSSGTPNDDGFLQITTAADATHYNYTMGSNYASGDADIGDATPFNPATDLPLQFGTLPNPASTQDYTIRVFNGASDCYEDITVSLQSQDCPVDCPPALCMPIVVSKN